MFLNIFQQDKLSWVPYRSWEIFMTRAHSFLHSFSSGPYGQGCPPHCWAWPRWEWGLGDVYIGWENQTAAVLPIVSAPCGLPVLCLQLMALRCPFLVRSLFFSMLDGSVLELAEHSFTTLETATANNQELMNTAGWNCGANSHSCPRVCHDSEPKSTPHLYMTGCRDLYGQPCCFPKVLTCKTGKQGRNWAAFFALEQPWKSFQVLLFSFLFLYPWKNVEHGHLPVVLAKEWRG